MVFPKKNIILVGIYNQQFQGTIILMVFDLQGIYIYIQKVQRLNFCPSVVSNLLLWIILNAEETHGWSYGFRKRRNPIVSQTSWEKYLIQTIVFILLLAFIPENLSQIIDVVNFWWFGLSA